mmetsp:Transcript_38266/g.123088  ORF Transcript_38266/g.123088 Transcript_38266/m.123088 type:complete len:225 (+) Transcript_38266:1686-2360(+)
MRSFGYAKIATRSIGKEPSSMLRCRSSATSSVPETEALTRLCRCLQSTAPAPKWFARGCSHLGACGHRGLQQLRMMIRRQPRLPKVVPLSPLRKEARSLGSALRLVVRAEPVVSVPCWSVLAAVCCLLTTCCRPSPGNAQQVGLALGVKCPGSLHFRTRREQRAEQPCLVAQPCSFRDCCECAEAMIGLARHPVGVRRHTFWKHYPRSPSMQSAQTRSGCRMQS